MEASNNGRLANGQFAPGNTFYKYSDEDRERHLTAYCVHLSYGNPKYEFPVCDYVELEVWADSQNGKREQIEASIRKGQAYWSGVLKRAALGLNNQFPNPVTGTLETMNHKAVNVPLLIFYLKSIYPKVYRESPYGPKEKEGETLDVPESVPFTVVENNRTEEFTMLGAAMSSYVPPKEQPNNP